MPFHMGQRLFHSPVCMQMGSSRCWTLSLSWTTPTRGISWYGLFARFAVAREGEASSNCATTEFAGERTPLLGLGKAASISGDFPHTRRQCSRLAAKGCAQLRVWAVTGDISGRLRWCGGLLQPCCASTGTGHAHLGPDMVPLPLLTRSYLLH